MLLGGVARGVVMFSALLLLLRPLMPLFRDCAEHEDAASLVGRRRVDVAVHTLQVAPEPLAREGLRLAVARVVRANVGPVNMLPPGVIT